MKKIAHALSLLFHPIFMPLLGFFIIFNSGIYESGISWEYKKYFYLINILFTVFLPLALISLLFYLNQVQSIELNSRRERSVPLMLTAVSFFLLVMVLHHVIPVPILEGFSLAEFFVVFVLYIASYWFKVSLHLSGLGGICGLIFVLSVFFGKDLLTFLSIALFVSGVVASSRLFLKAHSILEIISGYLIGFSGTFFIVLYFIKN
jgi:hypothetical protein